MKLTWACGFWYCCANSWLGSLMSGSSENTMVNLQMRQLTQWADVSVIGCTHKTPGSYITMFSSLTPQSFPVFRICRCIASCLLSTKMHTCVYACVCVCVWTHASYMNSSPCVLANDGHANTVCVWRYIGTCACACVQPLLLQQP